MRFDRNAYDSFEEDEFDEDSMPCPCLKCGCWFDLTDGFGSKKWYPNTVICETCFQEEALEIETDNAEQDLIIEIENGENVRENKSKLKFMGRPYKK